MISANLKPDFLCSSTASPASCRALRDMHTGGTLDTAKPAAVCLFSEARDTPLRASQVLGRISLTSPPNLVLKCPD
jgi:hypothetical protein